MSQGSEANSAGQDLETTVCGLFKNRKVCFWGKYKESLPLFTLSLNLWSKPSCNGLWKEKNEGDFLFVSPSRRIWIECKGQDESGSVDQKLNYIHDMAKAGVYFNIADELWVIWRGERLEGAANWLEKQFRDDPVGRPVQILHVEPQARIAIKELVTSELVLLNRSGENLLPLWR